MSVRQPTPADLRSLLPGREKKAIVALHSQGRVAVKRDMELVRKILDQVERKADLQPRQLVIEGYEPALISRHVEMLIEAGLVEGHSMRALDLDYPTVVVSDLSWSGHDFLTTLQNETVWAKIKQSFSAAELSSLPFSVLREVGIDLLTAWAKSKAGLGPK